MDAMLNIILLRSTIVLWYKNSNIIVHDLRVENRQGAQTCLLDMTLWNRKKTRFLHEIDKLVCYTVPTPHMCPIMSTISTTLNMTTIIIMNQYDKRVTNMSTMSTISSIPIMPYTPMSIHWCPPPCPWRSLCLLYPPWKPCQSCSLSLT